MNEWMNEWRLLVWLKNTDTGQNAIFRRRVRFVSFPDGTDMEGGGVTDTILKLGLYH